MSWPQGTRQQAVQPRTSMVAAPHLEDTTVLLPAASTRVATTNRTCFLHLLLALTTLLLTTHYYSEHLEDDAVHVGRAEAAPMLLQPA